MIILKTILIILAIIIAIAFVIIVFLLFYPFKYVLDLSFIEDEKLELQFKYIIFKVRGYLVYKPKVFYELKLWKKVLIESDKKEKNKEKNSIAETDFIENKNLESEITDSKAVIKSLFKSAKNLEKKKSNELNDASKKNRHEETRKEEVRQKVQNQIDKFKGIFKSDEIYVIKLVANEIIDALKVIKPDKINVKIKYGSNDPYTTGLLFSIAAPIYSIIGDDLNLKINGDKAFTESFMTLEGHPRLYKLIGLIFRLLIDKKFRKVISKKKKIVFAI